jgi:exopolyphosphatase/guanosine-5'-triphosphate,3'-diphosphate pyrophosphatase
MAKITTIIDIGSNSMRMVVFKKSSRFAFHLLNETKSKVKISQGSYENNGILQDIPLQRAFDTLKSFLQIAKNLKSRKILCVATSALRDAPNGNDFVKKVSKEIGINIKIIQGQKEAYFGAISSLNMLCNKSFISVDIGGGSTEFGFVEDKKILQTVSLKIGTVRMQELYFKNNDIKGAKEYIIKQLDTLPKTSLQSIVGLGGSARALSRIILAKDNYCLNVLHGFEYEVSNNMELFNNIINAKDTETLKKLEVRKDRYDTIKEGTLIFQTILEYFNIKTVVTSGVGVREGVYLSDILRTQNHKFPANFNVSVRSLLDRFTFDDKQTAYLGNNVSKIFDILKPLHNLDEKYKKILITASKLQQIGLALDFYKNTQNSSEFVLNGLQYGFSHQSRVLISTIIKFSKKSLPKDTDLVAFKNLLPKLEILQWLSFMISLNIALNSEYSKVQYEYKLEDEVLNIKSNKDLFIVKKAVIKLATTINISVIL